MKYLKKFNEMHGYDSKCLSSTDLIVLEILDVIEDDPFLLTNEILMKSKYLRSQSNPSEGYFITFHYKTMVVEVSKFQNNFYIYGKVNNQYKNRFNVEIDEKLNDILYRSIRDASERNYNLIWLLEDRGILKSNTNELLERIIEFDVIKGDSVDLISLNSLYDFYDIKFSKIADIDFFTHHNIKYIE